MLPKIHLSIVIHSIRETILSAYGYTSVEKLTIDTVYNNEKYAYRVLPIYKFQYNYKNKPFITYMNGQNGKLGTGLPISAFKVAMLIIFILFLVIPAIIAILSVY